GGRRTLLPRSKVAPLLALYLLRSAPTLARGARPRRAVREGCSRRGRRQVRPSFRDARPDDTGRRSTAGAPARAVRPALARGADAAREPGGDGEGGARDEHP